MLISRDQTIAGIPAVQARDLMRRIRECAVTVSYVAEFLGVADTEAKSILDRLEHEGFMCRVEPFSRGGTLTGVAEGDIPTKELAPWGTTIAGNALSKARIGRPMPRAQAEGLLDGLIARAAAVNEDPTGVFTVESVSVFGSFADPAREQVGDVDVHVVFSRRVDGDEFLERCLAAADAAAEQGHRFATHHDRLTYLEMSFRRQIRGPSSRLDVQFDNPDNLRLPPDVTLRTVFSR